MARREVTQFFDDLDHTQISEDELEVIHFGVGFNYYTLDVSKENAEKFYEAIAPFVEAARRTPKRKKDNRPDPRQVRAWATERGIEVASRGKIPFNIIQQYKDVHGLA